MTGNVTPNVEFKITFPTKPKLFIIVYNENIAISDFWMDGQKISGYGIYYGEKISDTVYAFKITISGLTAGTYTVYYV